MTHSSKLSALVVATSLVVAFGCAPMAEEDVLHVVAPGKADDYYSDVSIEYVFRGEVPLEMTAEEAADEAMRADVAARRVTAVGLYLTTYLTDKFEGMDVDGDGTISEDEIFFFNAEYGGFSAMVRNHPAEPIAVRVADEGGYVAAFAFNVAGPRHLFAMIPRAQDAPWDSGHHPFDLLMPAGATVDPSTVTGAEIRTFHPETHQGDLEAVRLFASPETTPSNAYPQYEAFMSDGVFDVALVFSHDYRVDRLDLWSAEQAFDVLVGSGFEAPVESFEALEATSGPLRAVLYAGGAAVDVEVFIYHSDMFVDDRPGQRSLVLQELATRDVFFYNGHAGPYYGFYLDGQGLASVDAVDLATAPLSSKQQLFVANGCQTYSQYADMLYANPAKSEENLDVINTVNFSHGNGSLELLYNLIGTDAFGFHAATDFAHILSDLNTDEGVFYGVIGITENPRLHPYADVAAIGRSCSVTAHCGEPTGNICAAGLSGERQCGVVATDASGCPEGTQLLQVADESRITAQGCFAR